MKNRLLNAFFLSVIVCLMANCKQQNSLPGTIFSFNLNEVDQKNDIATLTSSKIFNTKVLNVKVKEGENQLVITDDSKLIDWHKAKYLVCDLYQKDRYSAIIYIDFYKKSNASKSESIVQQGGQANEGDEKSPRISPKIGILPLVKTRMIFPLSYLDGQQIFLKRFPRQLKGTVMGRRLDLSDVGKVAIRIEPVMSPDYLTNVEIADIFLADTIPAPLEQLSQPIVDQFGQWSMKNWEGKTASESDLKNNLHELESIAGNAVLPDDWSIYGGWKQKKFKATGFFRTQNDGKRWWFVDPDGYAFLSAGIDCIRDKAEGTVTGQDDLFAWLPPKDDPLFSKAYSNQRNRMLQVDFVQANLMRVYGADSRIKWEQITTGLLKQWRINTIANWSDLDYARKAKIPYVLNMSRFPTTKVLLYRDFPDVFSDEYAKNSIEFAKQLAMYKNDPYLIGYFLSNEPQWAFGDNNLAFEMFATNQLSATKEKMAEWLKSKYNGNISAFNGSWKQNIKDFKEIPGLVMKESPSSECWNDCKDFSGTMVDNYVKIVCDEVKKIDSNHLNLGMRYAWMSSELCYRAGAYFDVFSINGYSFPGPPQTAEITRRSGKPVIIGEYHFGSIDRGLPATGIQGAENQQARGEAYRYYLEQGFSRPELIGIHYFQWMDQPIFGRSDGENYNIGFLDICLHPYKELANQAKLSHERMYKVAAAEEKAFDKIIRKTPQIFY
jgi:hypothetical protein